jgi:hypothetical protein
MVLCVSVLSRWEMTCICLIGSLIKKRLVCVITCFVLHLALEFSRHMAIILLTFLNQLHRQIRSMFSGISIFLSLSKRRKRLCLLFIRRPRNFDKVIIYYFVYICSSIWCSHRFNHFIWTAGENLWPFFYFVLPDIFREIVAISVISTNFRSFFFFLKFLQELSDFLFSSFASYPKILKNFMY